MVVVRYEAGKEGYRLLPSLSGSKQRSSLPTPPASLAPIAPIAPLAPLAPFAPLAPIFPAYLGIVNQGEEARLGTRGKEDSKLGNSQPVISQLGLRLFQTSSKEVSLGEVRGTVKPWTRVKSGRGKLQLVRHQRLPQAAYQTKF